MSFTDRQDRFMHLLLSEALSAEVPPDLTQTILARAFPTAVAERPAPGHAMPLRRTPARRRWPMALAAAAVLMLAASLWLYFYVLAYPAAVLAGDCAVVGGGPLARGAEVRCGQKPGQLILGGYCRVELAPHTRLRWQGGRRNEALYLFDGALTCDVQHHIGAFAVESEVGTVRVTGTQFQASVTDGLDLLHSSKGDHFMVLRQLRVAVLGGMVMVSGAWGQTAVTTGQQQTFHAATTTADPNKITGKLTAVGAGQLTLQQASGTVVVNLTDETVIKVDGTVGGVGNLKTGLYVLAITTDGKTATEIRAYTPKATTPTTPTAPTTPPVADANKVFGTVTGVGGGQMTLQNQSKTATVTLTATTTFTINGKPGTAADLLVGMHALAITTDGKTATEIKAYTPHATTAPAAAGGGQTAMVYGTLTAGGESTVTLTTPKGAAVTLGFNDQTTVQIAGKPAKITDLKVGMHAAINTTPDGKTATVIKAYMPTHGK